MHACNEHSAVSAQGMHMLVIAPLQAEMKLRGAFEENSSITQEIATMKVTLMKLQTERLKSGGRAAQDMDAALAKVWYQCSLNHAGECSSVSHIGSPYSVDQSNHTIYQSVSFAWAQLISYTSLACEAMLVYLPFEGMFELGHMCGSMATSASRVTYVCQMERHHTEAVRCQCWCTPVITTLDPDSSWLAGD